MKQTGVKKFTGYKLLLILFSSLSACILLLPLSFPASAETPEVPPELQAKLLLTALAYNTSLEHHNDSALTIAVIYFSDVHQSREQAETFFNLLEGFKDKTVANLPFKSMLLPYSSPEHFRQFLRNKNIDVAYIVQGKKEVIREITEITRSEKVFSSTNTAEYVADCRVSFGIGIEDTKPKIYINIGSSKAEGTEFSSRLMRVVKIIE